MGQEEAAKIMLGPTRPAGAKFSVLGAPIHLSRPQGVMNEPCGPAEVFGVPLEAKVVNPAAVFATTPPPDVAANMVRPVGEGV